MDGAEKKCEDWGEKKMKSEKGREGRVLTTNREWKRKEQKNGGRGCSLEKEHHRRLWSPEVTIAPDYRHWKREG